MPATTVTYDWGVLSACGQAAATEYRDGNELACPLIRVQEEVKGKGNPKFEGGQNMPGPSISMVQHTGITQFSDGYEEYDSSANETQRTPLYPLAMSGLLMKIGGKELRTYSSTPNGLRRKIESLTKSCMGFMRRGWEKRIIAGIGSGFGEWITFNGFDSTGGIFEDDAIGSQTNVIGGLSKATYSTVVGWQNVVVNLNNAYGTNVNGLYQVMTTTKRHKDGGKKVWLWSDQGINNYKRSVQAYERYTSSDKLDMGKPVLVYGGHPVYQQPQMPVSTATGGSTTNTKPWTALFLDFDDIHFAWSPAVKFGNGQGLPDGFFGVGDWSQIAGNITVYGCPMAVAGQTYVADMGSSGIAYGGETY